MTRRVNTGHASGSLYGGLVPGVSSTRPNRRGVLVGATLRIAGKPTRLHPDTDLTDLRDRINAARTSDTGHLQVTDAQGRTVDFWITRETECSVGERSGGWV